MVNSAEHERRQNGAGKMLTSKTPIRSVDDTFAAKLKKQLGVGRTEVMLIGGKIQNLE